ncbi:MAG: prephenate dehydrogenase/arogenate dehydrogenase family protein [Pseudomonadota bacterium]|nr:prephenate dehydrogenase/arogenate dehydrogenase family protein [Pseudomonadota bacterium]
MFGRITIIGLGLIGSSIARAAHERKLAKIIVGCDADKASLEYARKHGFVDEAIADPVQAVTGSDLVILATPPSTLGGIAITIAPKLKAGAIVMDVCSVKQPAIDAIVPHLPERVFFIPAHPIAGSEQSGVVAGSADLFNGKRVIVTPEQGEKTPALVAMMQFWQDMGMGVRVEAMPALLHDLAYAYVSHLPQLLAFAAAPLAEGAPPPFLRLADSPAVLWENIFELNKENILKALDRYLDVISHIIKELSQAPEEPLSLREKVKGEGVSISLPSPGASAFAKVSVDTSRHPERLKNDIQMSFFEPFSPEGEGVIRSTLFPRLAASCLVTTVMEAEKKAGFPMARYAGSGFADFTAPAGVPPDGDIESISGHHAAMAALLDVYAKRLKTMRGALAAGNFKILRLHSG